MYQGAALRRVRAACGPQIRTSQPPGNWRLAGSWVGFWRVVWAAQFSLTLRAEEGDMCAGRATA